ncbi:hypothetical protein [Streptomyces sp. NPDC055036]
MVCNLCGDKATHYYESLGMGKQARCAYHAKQFGCPEYLVELEPPKAALRVPGYLVLFNEGDGVEDGVAATRPFERGLAEFWVWLNAGAEESEARWLIDDAAYDPYHPQYMERGDLTVEVTRVTCLPVVYV